MLEVEKTIEPMLGVSQIAMLIFAEIERILSAADGSLHVAEDCVRPAERFALSAGFTSERHDDGLLKSIFRRP